MSERAPATLTQSVLGQLLAALLPTADETWFLRACLLSGQEGRRAWIECQRRFGSLVRVFREDSRGLRRWAPLLHEAVQRNGIEVDAALLTCLRTATFREELRTREYLAICAEVLAVLHAEGIPVIVLKGPALGELVYRRMALRHSHDVELLLRQSDHQRAAQLLGERGFRSASSVAHRPRAVITLDHASGLPIVLHQHPAGMPADPALTAQLWDRGWPCALGGVPTRVLSPEDMLVHVCAYAATSPARLSLLWVSDVWLLTGRHPAMDWPLVEEVAIRARRRVTVGAMLAYLAGELRASISMAALARFRTEDRPVDPAERDAIVSTARWTTDGGTRDLLQRLDWPGRILLLRWLLLPSSRHLEETRGLRHVSLAPLVYVSRALGYVAHRAHRLAPRRGWLSPPGATLADAGARPTPPGGARAGLRGRGG
jgi:hypothetical protein